MIPAVSYLRCSGRGQVDGDTWARQRAAIEKHAKANGVEVVQEFRDEGVSGTKELEHRPGLAALLDRLESNGVLTVLVERADRLARDLLVGEVILGQFRTLGVTVIEAESGTDLTVGDNDPTRVLIRQVLGAVAQFEKSVIVAKLKAARDRIRCKSGRCEGPKPFGLKAEEGAVVEQIKALRAAGKTYREVAEHLMGRGIKAPRGGAWSISTIRRIILRKA